MRTPRSIPRINGVSLLGISLWIVYNDDLPELNTKYSKLLLVIYSTPSPHHAMPRKPRPSYTSKTWLTRLFTRLRQVSTSWWSVVSWDQKRYCYVLFIPLVPMVVNSKLSKTNFPHLWAISILSPSYHPFTTASLILTRLKTFHKYCI